jgi:hypothetical protein
LALVSVAKIHAGKTNRVIQVRWCVLIVWVFGYACRKEKLVKKLQMMTVYVPGALLSTPRTLLSLPNLPSVVGPPYLLG